jgi:hypothetical protein
MKGTLSLQRLKRAAAVAGVSALVVGGALLGTTQAHAALTQVGTGTGLTLTPASGAAGTASTTTPTFQSTACPANDNGSATLDVLDPTTPAGTTPQNIPAIQEGPTFAPASAAFGGSWSTTLAAVLGAQGNIDATAGTQIEVAVECFSDSQATAGGTYVNSTFFTINADGSFTANQTQTGPPQSVNVSMSASPNPAAGQQVTLTATVVPAGATGTIQFENNGANINGPATISGGSASTSTTFATAGTYTLAAVYTPSGNFTAGTPGSLSLNVGAAPTNAIPLTVTVPTSGSFTLTVVTTPVALTVTGLTGAGTIPNGQVKVNDTRNTYPGWVVSGQDSSWTGSGTFSGDQLGWTPTLGTTVAAGVTKGATVAPLTTGPGLGTTAAVLASAPHGLPNGFGESDLGATLNLAIPPIAPPGPYSSNLTITAVTTN